MTRFKVGNAVVTISGTLDGTPTGIDGGNSSPMIVGAGDEGTATTGGTVSGTDVVAPQLPAAGSADTLVVHMKDTSLVFDSVRSSLGM